MDVLMEFADKPVDPKDVLSRYEAEKAAGAVSDSTVTDLANEVIKLRAQVDLAGQWQKAAVMAAIPLEVLAGQGQGALAPTTYSAVLDGRDAIRNLLGTPVFGNPDSSFMPPAPVQTLAQLRAALRSILWIALVWNDHNFSEKDIRNKAEKVAELLGMKRGARGDVDDANALLDHIESVVQSYQYPNGWVPAEAGMPEPNKEGYLVWFEGTIAKSFVVPTDTSTDFPAGKMWRGHGGSHNSVKAWRPLPEPYRALEK